MNASNTKMTSFATFTQKLVMVMMFFFIGQTRVYAGTPVINIEIRNHLFIPSEIVIPKNTKVKLVIHNHDETDEEFESYELNREKVIIGQRKGIIFIGPLHEGEYSFFGEFFPKTAQGKVIVK